MIDVLPRFPESHLRMRIGHVESGKEVLIIRPQGITSPKARPKHRVKEFTDDELALARYHAMSEALIEFILKTVKGWMDEDPLIWCHFGAKIKMTKIATSYTITLYPVLP